MTLPESLERALQGASTVAAITGAGISAESGISTYRGRGGIYDDPEQGDRTVEALSGETLARDPDRTWRTLASLARAASGAEPNAGHYALTQIERAVAGFTLLTQNVDGLHRRAGTQHMIEIHGHVFDALCGACDDTVVLSPETLAQLERSPRCPRCYATLRPDVVLFGEMLAACKVDQMRTFFYEQIASVVVVVGTTAMFPYISQPVVLARQAGSVTVEVNPEPTPLSEIVDFSLRGPAGQWLPEMARAIDDQQYRRR